MAAAQTDQPRHVPCPGLKLLAELIADMANQHPGCIVATAAYQDRLFNRDVRASNRKAVLGWRKRFRAMLDEIAAIYPPRDDVDFDAVADMVSRQVEGGIVLSRALENSSILPQQVVLLRSYI